MSFSYLGLGGVQCTTYLNTNIWDSGIWENAKLLDIWAVICYMEKTKKKVERVRLYTVSTFISVSHV